MQLTPVYFRESFAVRSCFPPLHRDQERGSRRIRVETVLIGSPLAGSGQRRWRSPTSIDRGSCMSRQLEKMSASEKSVSMQLKYENLAKTFIRAYVGEPKKVKRFVVDLRVLYQSLRKSHNQGTNGNLETYACLKTTGMLVARTLIRTKTHIETLMHVCLKNIRTRVAARSAWMLLRVVGRTEGPDSPSALWVMLMWHCCQQKISGSKNKIQARWGPC